MESFHSTNVNPNMLQEVSGGNQQLLDILKRYPDFGRILDQLATEWKFDTLVHGDVKWDNCVIVPEANGNVTVETCRSGTRGLGRSLLGCGRYLQRVSRFLDAASLPADSRRIHR